MTMLLTWSGVYAQQAGDTVRLQVNPAAQLLALLYDVYSRQGVLLADVPLPEHVVSSLSYHQTTGAYRQAQAGRKQQDISLRIKGFAESHNIRYFGSFQVDKTYTQSLVWNIGYQTMEDGQMSDPHYLAVARPGNGIQQTYTLQGGVLFPWAKRWRTALMADYTLFDKYRVDYDPRVEIVFAQPGIRAVLGYHLGQHRFTAGAGYRYTVVAQNSEYSNNNQNKPANYDLYIRWMAGYGNLENAPSINTKVRSRHVPLMLGYAWIRSNRHVVADMTWTTSNTRSFRSSTDSSPDDATDDNIFARYRQTQWDGQLSVFHPAADGQRWNGYIKMDYTRGNNNLPSRGGKTYSANKTKVEAQVVMARYQHRQVVREVGLRTQLVQFQQRDALSQTSLQVARLTTQLFYSWTTPLGDKVQLTPYLSAGMVNSIQVQAHQGVLSTLTQIAETDYASKTQLAFYEQVVQHDIDFFSQQAWVGEAAGTIRFLQTGRFDTAIRFSEKVVAAPSLNQYRWNTQISLMLNY